MGYLIERDPLTGLPLRMWWDGQAEAWRPTGRRVETRPAASGRDPGRPSRQPLLDAPAGRQLAFPFLLVLLLLTWASAASALTVKNAAGVSATSGPAPFTIQAATGWEAGARYVWSYGDGTPSEENLELSSVTHTYTAPGRWKLTVTRYPALAGRMPFSEAAYVTVLGATTTSSTSSSSTSSTTLRFVLPPYAVTVTPAPTGGP